jgi:hypothetical protein
MACPTQESLNSTPKLVRKGKELGSFLFELSLSFGWLALLLVLMNICQSSIKHNAPKKGGEKVQDRTTQVLANKKSSKESGRLVKK